MCTKNCLEICWNVQHVKLFVDCLSMLRLSPKSEDPNKQSAISKYDIHLLLARKHKQTCTDARRSSSLFIRPLSQRVMPALIHWPAGERTHKELSIYHWHVALCPMFLPANPVRDRKTRFSQIPGKSHTDSYIAFTHSSIVSTLMLTKTQEVIHLKLQISVSSHRKNRFKVTTNKR